MRAGELLARLQPKTCNLDMGRGGVPELTRIDIAGALGMTKGTLGRALLEMIHLGDAPGVKARLMDLATAMVESEAMRRADALVTAELQAMLSDPCARHTRESENPVPWPEKPEARMRIIQLAVCELAAPNRCWVCAGRGQFMAGTRLISCDHCEGTGADRVTDTKRAKFLGVTPSGWHRNRKGRAMHEWLMREFADLMSSAEREFMRRCDTRA